jgi:hypothetical protein
MSYSGEERRRIIAESKSILSRPILHCEREGDDGRAQPDVPAPPVDVDLPPAESVSMRHRRELQERDARWARERRCERRDEQSLVEARIMIAVDQKLAAVRCLRGWK